MGDVIIIIPSQGGSADAFKDSAIALKRHLYPKAKIVQTKLTTIDGTTTVTMSTLNGHSFSFATAHNIKRVITVSHASEHDGPNLAFLDASVNVNDHQPWGSDETTGELKPEAKEFWQSVGNAMRANGKIIMLGCRIGEGDYATHVAQVTGKHVFAATTSMAAGDSQTALRYLRGIEGHHTPKPMKDFGP